MKKKGHTPTTRVKNPEPHISDPDWIIWAAWADRITFEEIKENGNIKTRLVSSNDFGYYSKMKGGAENLREQIEATSFINSYMTDSLPQDAIAVLGITEHDIYNPKYNYLFGTSLSSKKVGLVSTFRLVDYGDYTKLNIRKI